MKLMRIIGGIACVIIVIASCQQEVGVGSNELIPTGNQNINCTTPYVFKLEGEYANADGSGTWSWVWSAYNPNPGNGTGGTAQNMSHWGFRLNSCFVWNNIVSAAYSFDSTTWTSFTPAYEPDNSQNCVTDSVFKFSAGTTGTAKTYYRIVLNANYSIDSTVFGYFKSGNNTPCCTFDFVGIGCPESEGCSWSQGYWFAAPHVIWPDSNGVAYGQITIGGHHYTQAEGKAIWNTSNAGGIKDSKKAFLQVAAIKLSGSNVIPSAPVWADV